MPPRTIAIGDVHGCSGALRAVIDEVAPQQNDTLIMLGDCVDRGSDSRGVIDQLLAIRERCRLVTLLGNHEEMMLNHLDGRPQPDDWLECGGAQTLASYDDGSSENDPVLSQHVDYIRTWGDCFETDLHFFVHAAYEPERPLTQQHWQTLRWVSLKSHIPGPHASGKKAVVGHSSQKSGEVFDLGHLVCIDTYCWGGKWLTALDVASGQLWQADRNGRLRQS